MSSGNGVGGNGRKWQIYERDEKHNRLCQANLRTGVLFFQRNLKKRLCSRPSSTFAYRADIKRMPDRRLLSSLSKSDKKSSSQPLFRLVTQRADVTKQRLGRRLTNVVLHPS